MDLRGERWTAPSLCLVLVLLQASISACAGAPKTYIVHMAASEKPSSFDFHHEWYASTVKSVSSAQIEAEEEEDAYARIVYNYETAIHGFAARLDEDEAERMAEAAGVLAVLPETVLQLHTTRSPDFLGIGPEVSNRIWASGLADHDVVVGVLDTGIWPESPSFSDKGLGPVPSNTMDRDFPATVTFGNGANITGVSLYKGRKNLSPRQQYPVVYMGGNSSIPNPRSMCLEGTLEPNAVAGKIVICDRGISPRVQKGQVVKEAGGIGMILANTAANGEELVADSHLLPAVAVGESEGVAAKKYTRTAPKPTGTLSFAGTKLGIRPSPVVAAFSSRGPNYLTLEILKPDLIAPGVNILAAWSGDASPSSLASDRRRVGFNILSGTSMSCPHVAGVAALLKASHPDWSPAQIKSALMTTAYVHDNTYHVLKDAATGDASTPFEHGAGHIHPVRALNPGLVYDIGQNEYLEFLCTQNLTRTQLKGFTKNSNMTCKGSFSSPGDLNYPAISAVFSDQPATPLMVRRTVTNVGPPSSTYHVKVTKFKGADVVVEPSTLHFSSANQKLAYKVTLRTKAAQKTPEYGALSWSDGVHVVRSPLVLTWLPPM
uniref:Subtilisin-like protease n=1 Tax=Aegilops tauschii TaxID=37682 RepID=M8B1C8_AEGTA